jgi:NADH-quinone oxidoreductase subunit M
VLTLGLTLALWHSFNPASGVLQFQESHAWIPSLCVQYHLGIDGISLLMLVLSAIVTLIGMAASVSITKRVPLYYALVLLLQACLFGTFTAVNFIHWFLFWELALIPAFFLIALWGGPRAKPAAMQFMVYTMVGSVTMLLTFLALFLSTHTFEFGELTSLAQNGQLMPAVSATLGGHWITAPHLTALLFAGALLGFAVKVPLYPFHTWLPAAYSDAPSGTTAILTGAMSKMGLFGFVRILLPLFAPQMQQFYKPLVFLAVASIVFSAFAAMAQKDLKRIFAYSSINHLGYCLLAIFAVSKFSSGGTLSNEQFAAMDGVFLQMFNHGLTAATLFWFIAMLEQRSGGLRGLDDFGGLRKVMPIFTGLMGISLFSSLGLPGLNGFPGEFLLFKGTFPLAGLSTTLSLLGLLATALFLLRILQRVFSGPLNPQWIAMPDLSLRERVLLVPSITLMFVLGLYPQLILGVVNSTAIHIVQGLHP